MSRPQGKIVFQFPIGGVAEGGPLEGQPQNTTPNAQNVRSFAWVDKDGTPERGRLSGGQRAGIKNYHPTARELSATDGVSVSIQDINHISSDSIELLTGDDKIVLRSGNTSNLLQFGHKADPTLFGGSSTNLRVAGACWDDNNNTFVVIIDESGDNETVAIRKYDVDGTLVWTSTTQDSKAPEKVGGGTVSDDWAFFLQGVAWYGKYVYIRVRNFHDSETPASASNVAMYEKIFVVPAAATSAPDLVQFINSRKDLTSEVAAVSDRGWTTGATTYGAVSQVVGNGLAISKGRMAILALDGDDLTVWIKMLETGENIYAPVTITGSGSGTAIPHEITSDARGNFWVVGKLGDGVGSQALLLKIDREGTVTRPKAHDVAAKAPNSVCYCPISDRIFIAGPDDILGLGTDKTIAAFHASETKIALNKGCLDVDVSVDLRNIVGSSLVGLPEPMPFAIDDVLTFSTTGEGVVGTDLPSGTTTKIQCAAPTNPHSTLESQYLVLKDYEGNVFNFWVYNETDSSGSAPEVPGATEVQVGVASGDDLSAITIAFAAAINDLPDITAGTITYDHTEHADGERMVIFTTPHGFADTTAASKYHLEVAGISYPVATFVDSLKLTLDTTDNPGADKPAETAYRLHQISPFTVSGNVSGGIVRITGASYASVNNITEFSDVSEDRIRDGNDYTVTAVVKDADTGLYTVSLKDTTSSTDLALKGDRPDTKDRWELTRATGVTARVRLEDRNDSGPAAGAAIAFKQGGSTYTLEMIRMRTGGGAYVTGKIADESRGVTAALSKSNIDAAYQSAISGLITNLNTTPGVKMGANAVFSVDSDARSGTRQTAMLAVGGGTIDRVTATGFSSVENGDYALSTASPVIFSAQFGNEIYYADGISPKYYSHAVTDDGTRGSVKDWTLDTYSAVEVDDFGLSNTSHGELKGESLPQDSLGNTPRLIEYWDDRLVLSGLMGSPQAWFMSRKGNPRDFDYRVQPADDNMAVATAFSPAGNVPDKVNALIPYNDDILIFGCDHSIFQMSGNPAMGGRIDMMSDVTGMAWGRAWCKDAQGAVYFFGSRGGVYKMVPGRIPSKVTTTSIDERLATIDQKANVIRMAWNDREEGVHLFVSPTDWTQASDHYFFDARMGAWWIDKFETTGTVGTQADTAYVHNTMSPHVFDGDDPDDRVLLLGGRDGAIYKWDISSKDDYNGVTAVKIDSHVFMGPLSKADGSKVVLTELLGILAANSDNVDYDVYVGKTAEEIISAIGTADEDKYKRWSDGEFVAGRDRVDRRRAVAGDIFLKLRNYSLGENWALEKIVATLGAAGGRTNRSFEIGKKV